MIEWSVVCVAVAFIAVAAAAIWVLRTVNQTFLKAQAAIEQLQDDSEQLRIEVEELLERANRTFRKLDEHVHAVDPLFASARGIGETIEQVAAEVSAVSATLAESAVEHIRLAHARNEQRIGDLFEWVDFGFGLWKKWQQHRSSSSQTNSPNA